MTWSHLREVFVPLKSKKLYWLNVRQRVVLNGRLRHTNATRHSTSYLYSRSGIHNSIKGIYSLQWTVTQATQLEHKNNTIETGSKDKKNGHGNNSLRRTVTPPGSATSSSKETKSKTGMGTTPYGQQQATRQYFKMNRVDNLHGNNSLR